MFKILMALSLTLVQSLQAGEVPATLGTAVPTASAPTTVKPAALKTAAVKPAIETGDARNFRMSNVYITKDAFGKELAGLQTSEALLEGAANWTLPALAAVWASFNKGDCEGIRTLLKSLSVPEFKINVSGCGDKRQLLRDLGKLSIWNFIVPKSSFGFTPTVTTTLAPGFKGEVALTEIIIPLFKKADAMAACGKLVGILSQIEVSREKLRKDSGKNFTQGITLRGSCEIDADDLIAMKTKIVL